LKSLRSFTRLLASGPRCKAGLRGKELSWATSSVARNEGWKSRVIADFGFGLKAFLGKKIKNFFLFSEYIFVKRII
jgi:hypothetical protein